MHRAGRELLLAGLARVMLGLLDAVPAEHGHELVSRGAVLGGGGGVELANTMG